MIESVRVTENVTKEGQGYARRLSQALRRVPAERQAEFQYVLAGMLIGADAVSQSISPTTAGQQSGTAARPGV